jgi:hypothetical protein
LSEWYINDARGLEQGFTLTQPPAGPASGVLVLTMSVETELLQYRRGIPVRAEQWFLEPEAEPVCAPEKSSLCPPKIVPDAGIGFSVTPLFHFELAKDGKPRSIFLCLR